MPSLIAVGTDLKVGKRSNVRESVGLPVCMVGRRGNLLDRNNSATRMCYVDVLHGCATWMCYRDVLRGCATGMCRVDVLQGCAT